MIDWKRVSELRSEIGESDFDEVVELFLEEVEGLLSRLKKDPQPDLYHEDLHFLKGCSANLGFGSLAAMCLSGETIAAGGAPENVALAPIFECFERSKAQFFDGLEKGLAA
ncbi:Hpt domain-containing protein [Tropicimonas sp. TH_r6]|uniref:Hpt domain-containing protein n=1 Tax=Tropicimonas sp. TH_r6 TaxID=3082085 RepID=UPI002953ED8D|nr:Hpt domain-containing protein [Tropicimonas sp. TH_r6]MDV7141248.1 Hpt domain-containing protein [Tropicimonas sp. TH_r6]